MGSLPGKIQTPATAVPFMMPLGIPTPGGSGSGSVTYVFAKTILGSAGESVDPTRYEKTFYVTPESLAKLQGKHLAPSLDTDARRMGHVGSMVEHIAGPVDGTIAKAKILGITSTLNPPTGIHSGGVFSPPMHGAITAVIGAPPPTPPLPASLVPPHPMAPASTGSGSISSPTSFQVMLERAKTHGVCLFGGRDFPLTAFLDNSHIAPISYGTKPDGTKQTYRCAEAAYQAQKFPVGQRAAFENLSGQQAIMLARQKIAEMYPKPDEEVWDNQKDEIMHDVLQEKFKQNPELKTLLLSTGEIPLGLVGEGYWSYHTGGKNNFGELLMRVRTELREPPAAGSPSAPSGSPPPVHAAPMASALPPTPPPTGRVALSPAAPISAGVPAARLPGASVPTRKLLEMPAEVGCPEFTPLTRDELNSFLGGAVFREFVELRSLHGDATMTEGIESAYSNGLQGRIPDSRACQIFSQQMKYVMYTIARAKPEDQRKLLRELTDGMQDCAPVAQRTVDRMYQRFIGSSGFESQFTAFIKGEKEKAVDRVIKRMYPRFSSEGYDPARDRPWNQEPHLKNGYIRFLGGEIGLKIGGSDTDPNANNVDPGERGAEFLRLFHEEFSVGNLVHSFVEQVNGSSEGAWRREINNTTFYSWCGDHDLGGETVYIEEEAEKYPAYTHPGDEHKAETAAYITEQTALSVFTKLGYVS